MAKTLVAGDVTLIGSVRASDQDSSLRIMDFWLEPSAGITDGDDLPASAIGVSAIRGILGFTVLDGGAWLGGTISDYVGVSSEQRAREGYRLSGSTASAPAAANDADGLDFYVSATRDAMWIQLLVEA